MLLSFPASFCAGAIYSFIVDWLRVKFQNFVVPVFWISTIILFLSACEFIASGVWSILDMANVLGWIYIPIHNINFFLTLPSLVHVMKLQQRVRFFTQWHVIAIACAFLGFFIVCFQYDVHFILFGVL